MNSKCASCNSGIGVMMSSIATEPLCYECWKWVWDLLAKHCVVWSAKGDHNGKSHG